jgi:hypothetical protein
MNEKTMAMPSRRKPNHLITHFQFCSEVRAANLVLIPMDEEIPFWEKIIWLNK